MSEFEEDLRVIETLYEDGKYSGAIQACSLALEYTRDNEEIVVVFNKRGWAARYDGFKSENEAYRKEMYKIAREDWRKVLELSSDTNLRISAIKGLMLLPGENGKELYQTGIVTIDKYANNLKAEIGNSYGLMVREKDPMKATTIFWNAYKTVEKGTIIAGHLMQNLGTCLLILKNNDKDPRQKLSHAIEAVQYLKIAMKEYPENQFEHRRSTQRKIDKTETEIIIEELKEQ